MRKIFETFKRNIDKYWNHKVVTEEQLLSRNIRSNATKHTVVCDLVHNYLRNHDSLTITDEVAVSVCSNTFDPPIQEVYEYMVGNGYLVEVADYKCSNDDTTTSITLTLCDKNSPQFQIAKSVYDFRDNCRKQEQMYIESIEEILTTKLLDNKQSLANGQSIVIDESEFGKVNKKTIKTVAQKFLSKYGLFIYEYGEGKLAIAILN